MEQALNSLSYFSQVPNILNAALHGHIFVIFVLLSWSTCQL